MDRYNAVRTSATFAAAFSLMLCSDLSLYYRLGLSGM